LWCQSELNCCLLSINALILCAALNGWWLGIVGTHINDKLARLSMLKHFLYLLKLMTAELRRERPPFAAMQSISSTTTAIKPEQAVVYGTHFAVGFSAESLWEHVALGNFFQS